MFENRYKSAMDKVSPSEDALNKALNIPVKKRNVRNILRTVSIACILVALTCTTVFTAFKLSNINLFNDNSESNEVNNSGNGNGNSNINLPNSQITLSLSEHGFKFAESYEEIYEHLQDEKYDEDVEVEEGTGDIAGDYGGINDNQSTISGSSTPGYSDTNNQVAGVQESDIVKTDGRYIYTLNKTFGKVYIAEADNGNLKYISELDLDVQKSQFNVVTTIIHEMLLLGDRLAVITQTKDATIICTYYDLTDKSKPKKIAETSQSGYYTSCRAINGIVYIITSKRVYTYIDNYERLPIINGAEIDYCNVIICDGYSSNYTVITSFDSKNDKMISDFAFLGSSYNVYCNSKNIYFTKTVNNSFNATVDETVEQYFDYTKILKMELNEGNTKPVAVGKVDGTLNDQFSMDEKDGIFRIATTMQPYYVHNLNNDVVYELGDRVNRVYCLDEELTVIGVSEDLGITETIKSVRFKGDVAYVVTFKQTDPLYAVDLSEPTNPTILSEFKIDGFSTYMHPYGNDYMLGIGYEADPETGFSTGIKLTMFNVKDSKNVFEADTLSYLWSKDYLIETVATKNHKAVLIDANKGIIGIPVSLTGYSEIINPTGLRYTYTEYKLFTFDGENITEICSFDCAQGAIYYNGTARGLYIGDYIYVVTKRGIQSFSLNDYSAVGSIKYY